MSLRKRLILSAFSLSFLLSVLTILVFSFIALREFRSEVERAYQNIIRSFTYSQRLLGEGVQEVRFTLEDCGVRERKGYTVLTEDGLFVGRVDNCVFYGSHLRKAIEFTAEVNGLSWMVVYDRDVVQRIAEGKGDFMDRFVRDKVLEKEYIVEGFYDPAIVKEIKDLAGYKLISGYRTLVVEYPVLVEGSVPVGRVVFVKDFSAKLKEIFITPAFLITYSVAVVVLLSTVLLLIFNRIVGDILMLRDMTMKFKDLDFSEADRLASVLRKTKSRDELYYLKRAVLTMAQELETFINRLQDEKNRFEELAYKDPLTDLDNRRSFTEKAKAMAEYAKRYGEPLSVLMIDIDNFKKVNDTYGHDVGDRLLKALADVIRRSIRSSDTAARFGGEEFVVLLPRTDEEGARLVADRIRKGFKEVRVDADGERIGSTVSIGVATMRGEDGVEEVIKRADEALYEAKRSGKDRVVVFRGTGEDQGKG
ncbi:MAG: GGDEF domain-containing protein [Aquificota bacterium]|nr:GGDEF domain-containing protein [Aquificota bacterium]